jgi:hypothetical protein
VTKLDIEVRGAIEHTINFVYQKQNMLEGLDWILEVETELTNLNDFALGYFLGSLMQIAINQAETLKDSKKFAVRFEKFKKEQEKNPKKRMRRVTWKLTEEETDEIRDIIKRWVIPFRQKLNTEIDIRNAKTKS